MTIRKIRGKDSDTYIVVEIDAKNPLAVSYFADEHYADKAIKLLKDTLAELGHDITTTDEKMA